MNEKITFHIRAPKRRQGAANEFYPATGYRADKTLCGEPVTDRDIRFGWGAFDDGVFACCEECKAVRGRVLKGRRAEPVA